MFGKYLIKSAIKEHCYKSNKLMKSNIPFRKYLNLNQKYRNHVSHTQIYKYKMKKFNLI